MKKLYNNDIQRLYLVISSIANLKQPVMDISSYGGQMFVIKDELALSCQSLLMLRLHNQR